MGKPRIKNVYTAVKQLPESCRSTFLDIWSMADVPDTGNGELIVYFCMIRDKMQLTKDVMQSIKKVIGMVSK